MSAPKPLAGSCVCGAVRFTVTEPFRFFQYCHCSRCRKRSGSLHAANIAVPLDQLTFTTGESGVKTFELADASSWGNAFCETCGSGLPWKMRAKPETPRRAVWIVPAGCLDAAPTQAPNRNIYFGSRAPWHVDASTLDHFDAAPERK